MRNKIYLACPYSHEDEAVRISRFEKVNLTAGALMREGALVFSPISHTHPIAVACDLPLDFAFWEAYNRTFLEWCDEVYVVQLHGWVQSKGVRQEVAIARELDKPVKYIVERK